MTPEPYIVGPMPWAEEPATWKQLKYLKELGYRLDHRLTKAEADELLQKLGAPPVQPTVQMPRIPNAPESGPYRLHAEVQTARKKIAEASDGEKPQAEQAFAQALGKRQVFWLDTCRDPAAIHQAKLDLMELYRKYGCVFCAPTAEQVQAVLDALDAAAPTWDCDHPELFYQALELNFPELRRRV